MIDPMRTVSSLALAVIILTTACTREKSSEEKLPVLGHHQYIDKTVDNQTVTDTVYHKVADFKFVDQDSTIVTHDTFKDKIYVTDFFFTSCPTICPVMKQEMLRVYDEFKDYDDVLLLSHTIDPKYDTVALLRDYSERLGVSSDKWHFVTGDKEAIYDMGLKSYMVTAMEDESSPGGFMHSGAFILVDKDRRVRGMYDGTKKEQVDVLINDIHRLLKEYEHDKASS